MRTRWRCHHKYNLKDFRAKPVRVARFSSYTHTEVRLQETKATNIFANNWERDTTNSNDQRSHIHIFQPLRISIVFRLRNLYVRWKNVSVTDRVREREILEDLASEDGTFCKQERKIAGCSKRWELDPSKHNDNETFFYVIIF